MDKQQIIEGNKAIAKFMGAKISYTKSDMSPNGWVKFNDDPNTFHALDKLMFHNSWDWIIPVVEKIWKMEARNPFELHAQTLCRLSLSGFDITNTWNEVIAFIKYSQTLDQHGT